MYLKLYDNSFKLLPDFSFDPWLSCLKNNFGENKFHFNENKNLIFDENLKKEIYKNYIRDENEIKKKNYFSSYNLHNDVKSLFLYDETFCDNSSSENIICKQNFLQDHNDDDDYYDDNDD